MSGEDSDVTLYFRASYPQRKVVVRVLCGEKEISRRRLVRINPGEMEHSAVKLQELDGSDITVCVSKE